MMKWFTQNTALSSAEVELPPLYEPPPVEFSFSAPGWIVVFGLFACGVLFLIIRKIIAYRRNGYRRDSIQKLRQMEGSSLEPLRVFTELRLVAMVSYGRDTVAALQGKEWMEFLDEHGKKTSFSSNYREFTDAIYMGENLEEQTQEKLLLDSINWIRSHA